MINWNQLTAYELMKEENLADISSKGYLLRHKKSGAHIALVSNDDDNKVFSIAFRTPPSDETGVAHITEHTTLCGSAKYPLKDPFVDLVKGSLNTFLNAITYPDKTVYPLASYNNQDFKNLMDVYLDAVFNPMLLKEPMIFEQEGWHYELEDEEGELTINGVVYNEMKGSYSDPDGILYHEILKALYPDTAYRNDSGGNPRAIPNLTYEDYVAFYKKYYHPSNSYIYMYGDMDIEERLLYLDREYLSKYEMLEMDTAMKLQAPFSKTCELEGDYSVASDDSTDKSTYLSYSWVVADALDKKRLMAIEVLESALISSPGAPVVKALLDAGIGSDVYSDSNNGLRQASISVVAKGAEASEKDRFVSIVREVLEKQVREGINHDALLAAINSREFHFREADFGRFPKGLLYGLSAYDAWTVDEMQPFLFMNQLNIFAELKEEISTGYFEQIVKEQFLDNPHSAILVLKPNPGKSLREEEALQKSLQEYKQTLSREQIQEIVKHTKALHEYQETPSDEKYKDCLPMLTRADLREKAMEFKNAEVFEDGIPIVHHEYDSNGIDYVTMLFSVEDLRPEDLSLYRMYLSLLSYMDTEHYDYNTLSNQINIYSGSIAFRPYSYTDSRTGKLMHKLAVKFKTLEENFDKTLELIDEIIYKTDFSDVKHLLELVRQSKSRLQSDLSSSGNSTASTRALSHFSEGYRLMEEMNGIAMYRAIVKMEKQLESDPQSFIDQIRYLHERVFAKDRLMISFTGKQDVFERALPILRKHLALLPDTSEKMTGGKLDFENVKEGFTDASQIQYVCRAGDFKAHGYQFSGYLRMLKMILSYDYLWTNVRVLGGAYGCFANFTREGEGYFVSYRDPNLSKTNTVFEGVPEYLKNFDPDERTMTGYVISTFGAVDTPMGAEAKGTRSMNAYLTGISYEQVQRERSEILHASAENIRALAPLVQSVLDDGYFCVVGNEKKIAEEKDLFTHIEKMCE